MTAPDDKPSTAGPDMQPSDASRRRHEVLDRLDALLERHVADHDARRAIWTEVFGYAAAVTDDTFESLKRSGAVRP